VSTLISALVSTAAAYAIARVLYSVYTLEFFAAVPIAQDLVVYAATISVLAGSVLAVLQSEIKRMLAYSSVSQFGLVVAAFAIANETAFLGGTIHLVGHAVMKGGLFAAAGVIAIRTGARTVDEYADLAAEAPIASGTFALLGLALVGVPPAVGFVGKWYIALGAVAEGVWIIAGVILLSTLLTLAYFARVIERMYFGMDVPSEATAVADGGRPGLSIQLVISVAAAIAVIVMGFGATWFASLLEPTMEFLFNL
jgi:multicomponent Na+:H+ antiporter subunit D